MGPDVTFAGAGLKIFAVVVLGVTQGGGQVEDDGIKLSAHTKLPSPAVKHAVMIAGSTLCTSIFS